MPPTPSDEQRRAIEAPMGPVLVVAGPGAGKTFCLVERIRHLIEVHRIPPARICAFTFTNKAAQEISERLDLHGAAEGSVKHGTVHAFCAELLRAHGEHVGLRRGFGIADENYQTAVLARLGTPRTWQRGILTRFAKHRFRDVPLTDDDAKRFLKYEAYLAKRNVADFDQLLLRAEGAMDRTVVAEAVQSRFDYVLVDEFQDLNPVAFRFVQRLAAPHGNVFAVGDDEQSIYSWAGADPKVFAEFVNAYHLHSRVTLGENRRCPRQVVEPARRLVAQNRSIFDEPREVRASRESPFPVQVQRFATADDEMAWLVDDLQHDHATHGHPWGEVGVLYRTNEMGSGLEAELLRAGIPCHMALGRALADDPTVAYLMAALRVIAQPSDPVREGEFFRAVLPSMLFADAQLRAEQRDNDLGRQLNEIARERKGTEDSRMIRRAQVEIENLAVLPEQHTRLDGLVFELLSQRVGQYRSALDELHDDLSDPQANPEVQALAADLSHALVSGRPVAFAPMGGLDVALRGMLEKAQLSRLLLDRPHPDGPLTLTQDTTPSLGVALGLFKALQLLATREFRNVFNDFVALDFEATALDPRQARITEIGAVRVRSGHVVDSWSTLVNPGCEIPAKVTEKTGITNAMVSTAPAFGEVWPALRDFLGTDLTVAHNGHTYDFPLLRAELTRLGTTHDLRGYDSLPLARELHPGSRKLEELASAFGIDPGSSHRALDDTLTLAAVFPRLNALKLERARKTALGSGLEYLALGIALAHERPDEAGRLFPHIQVFPLFRNSRSLEVYREARERRGAAEWPTYEEVIDRLGGSVLMARVRAEKDADGRYPELMARLRRLMEALPSDAPLGEQISQFLETVVLSQQDGARPDHDRVNLLTLHSTKGLEFSRVYIAGVTNNDLLAGKPDKWSDDDIEEARRLLYVGMTRTKDRLVMTYADERGSKVCDDRTFLAEAGLLGS